MIKIKSALVSVLLMALLSIVVYILSVGDVFALDLRVLINVGIMSLLTGLVSLLKSWLTTDQGTFAGIQIK